MKEPSINEIAFACPYCGAYTSQEWFKTWADSYEKDHHPYIPDASYSDGIASNPNIPDEVKDNLLEWAKQMRTGIPRFESVEGGERCYQRVDNLNLSRCFVCSKITAWAGERIVFPTAAVGPSPNSDLPATIATTFEEARRIVKESPRGAAALLRLCVQELCMHLGEKGLKIDDDIKALVAKGLNPLVQKSLDIVRVIGNESVHPGSIDMKDDIKTALALFGLVNLITDQMITQPKHVAALYEKLPEPKRKGIENRDRAK